MVSACVARNARRPLLTASTFRSSTQAGFAGLDQVNIELPVSLRGRGEVEIVVTIDGAPANGVSIIMH
jgi:uncharacterized protein (TIGR03437 family)